MLFKKQTNSYLSTIYIKFKSFYFFNFLFSCSTKWV